MRNPTPQNSPRATDALHTAPARTYENLLEKRAATAKRPFPRKGTPRSRQRSANTYREVVIKAGKSR